MITCYQMLATVSQSVMFIQNLMVLLQFETIVCVSHFQGGQKINMVNFVGRHSNSNVG